MAQPFPSAQVTTGALIDRAFLSVRRLPPWELLPAYAFVVLAAGLLAAVAWAAHEPGPARGWSEPGLLRRLTAARLGLVAAELAVGMGLARAVWAACRGPLEEGAPATRVVLSGLGLCPVLAVLTFLPEWVLARDALTAGRVTLLPGEWTADARLLGAAAARVALLPFLLLAPAVVVVEGGGAVRALLRSARLVVTSLWRVHGVYAAFWLMQGVLGAGLAMVLAAPEAVLSQEASRRVALGCAGLVVHALLVPQLQVALLLAYLQSRVRNEGLDVEHDGRHAGLLTAEGEA